MSEPWLTKRELARALKVSPKTIQRHYTPTMRVGGQNRYLLSQVEAQSVGQDLPDNVTPIRPRRTEVAA